MVPPDVVVDRREQEVEEVGHAGGVSCAVEVLEPKKKCVLWEKIGFFSFSHLFHLYLAWKYMPCCCKITLYHRKMIPLTPRYF